MNTRTSRGTAPAWAERRVPVSELTCVGKPNRVCYRIGDLQPETDYMIEVCILFAANVLIIE